MIEESKRLPRALGYALSLVSFQEVGAGPDKNLGEVRDVVTTMRNLCFDETGIKLESYPTQFLKDNKELLLEKKLPYTVLRLLREKINMENAIKQVGLEQGIDVPDIKEIAKLHNVDWEQLYKLVI